VQNTYQKHPRSSSFVNTEKHNKRIDSVFLRLAAIYGHVWRSLFKSNEFLAFTKNEWQEGLKQFEDEVLNQAIDQYRNQNEMPPSLSQMITYCKQIKKTKDESKTMVQNKTIPRKLSYEEVKKHLQQCKEILAK
jgi:hypothetical protein